MTQEKAKYRVLRLSFIGNQLLDEGAEVEYDGEPGSALEPINDAAEAAKKKAMTKHGHPDYDVKPATVNVLDGGSNEESSGAISDDLASLRQQYEDLFNEKPGNMKAETLKERIADKRKELGV
ncbi:hypothetical protein [Atlantibacter hermannii]|uniref:hypothetical protein n=1 Tax=Atlantibacter hermannii TaxID=565 RepID=UPI0028AB5409|nr:hypothetical protein [Atlantibacter hermannii]